VALLGLDMGLAACIGLTLSLLWAITVGGGRVWLRYAAAVRSAARHDLLPSRPAIFLDWCLNVGLMRMSGSAMQFRHRQLQDSLTKANTNAEAEDRLDINRKT
jgi:hypothetical protein